MSDEVRDGEAVAFEYTNYRGEKATRHVIPVSIRFGSDKWHTETQWLMEAFDCDKGVDRTFALKDVSNWRPAS